VTNNEFLTLILSRLGKRQGNDYLKSAALLEVQVYLAQREMTMEEPPFFLETKWEGTMQADQEYLDLPGEFLKEIEETGMIARDPSSSARFRVVKRIPDRTNELIAGCSPQQPQTYSIFGNKLYFGPTPDKAYTFSLPYARKSAIVLANDVQVTDWCLHATQAVSNTIQSIMASQHLQDDQMAQKYAPLAAQAWAAFKDYCNARKYTNLTISSGDDDES
jgi:hypothetical protein